jgi:lipopolysaccharide transport system ATP-binding protein
MSDEVLVKCEHVSKKFCRSLKRSLWYGVQDIASELNPFHLGQDVGSMDQLMTLRKDEFWVVEDVSFELKRGECMGLIGPNGAGKSTLLKMLNGLIKPDHGRITMKGGVGALIELNAGFNPILTGRENVYINGAVLGFTKKEMNQKYDEIVEFAELADFMEMPVQSYSSGMKVRLGFAIASQMEPSILLIDEVLAVGDMGFRSKCYSKIADLIEKCAVIFVSHQMYFVNRLCSLALLLNRGKKIFQGKPPQAITAYNALFKIDRKVVRNEKVVDIINLILLDRNNLIRDTFIWYDSFVVEFDLIVSKKYKEVSISFSFMGQDGALAAQCHSSYNNVKIETNYSCNKVRLEIESLNLNPGVYYLNLIVYDNTDNRQLVWLYADRKFEVVGNFCGGASVQLKGHWSVNERQ